jgi:hypothetical protein
MRPAGEVVRVEVAEHELGIGHRRHRAAAPVADRAGNAPALSGRRSWCALRLHAHQAAAAGADRLQVDLRQEVLVLVGVEMKE